MRSSTATKHLFPFALLIMGLIIFGFFVLGQTGLLRLALLSDQSMVSWIIFALYFLASAYWLRVAWQLDLECRMRVKLSSAGSYFLTVKNKETVTLANSELAILVQNEDVPSVQSLGHYAETLENRHAPGRFLADLLLKLGLIGTIIGFILMLSPIGEIKEFDPSLVQQLLSTMSGGMAVALYTTLAGLVTSSLLKIQYYFLDSVLVAHIGDFSKDLQGMGKASVDITE